MLVTNILKQESVRSLHTAAAESALRYQSLLNNSDALASALANGKEELDKAVSKYNSTLTKDVHAELLKSDTPILDALTRGFYPAMSVKKKSKDDVHEVHIEVDKEGALVDIARLTKAGAKDVADALWTGTVSQLTEFLRLAGERAVTDDPDAVADKASKVKGKQTKVDADHVGAKPVTLWDRAELAAEADPFSIGTLRKGTQAIADMILADAFKVRKKDVRYIVMLMAKEGKKNKIRFASDDTVIRLLTKMLFTMINGLDYETDEN